MPHCIIEHSSTISAQELLSNTYAGALASGLFEPDGSDIKVRAQSFSCYQTGNNPTDFVHVTLKILDGRSLSQKQLLSKSVLDSLKSLALNQCSITVEVVDIERASYAKLVS